MFWDILGRFEAFWDVIAFWNVLGGFGPKVAQIFKSIQK